MPTRKTWLILFLNHIRLPYLNNIYLLTALDGVACVHGAFSAPPVEQLKMMLPPEGWTHSFFITAPYILNAS